MRKIKVKCTIFIEVEYQDNDPIEFIEFDVEENHCPGTGRFFTALKEKVEKQDEGNVCIFCPHDLLEIVRDENWNKFLKESRD